MSAADAYPIPEGSTVHFLILEVAQTLCGQTWPMDGKEHWSVSDPERARKLVNCEACLAEREHREQMAMRRRGK